MMTSIRSSLRHRSEKKRRRRTARRATARRETFLAAGWEQLEGRVLLTAAATITWTGGSTASANWSDPANWDLGRAPVNGDSLVFPASAQQFANNDDISGLSVNSITFQGTFTTSGGYTLSGDDLSLGVGGIVDNSSVNGATATLANQIDLSVALAAAQFWTTDDIFSYGQHQLTINGNVADNGFGLTAKGTGTIDVAGEITGSGSLSVVGVPAGVLAGQPVGGTFGGLTLELNHTNTYTGGTYVDDSASVSVSADGALGPGGTDDAGTTVAQGGAILFNAVAYSTPEAIAINGGSLAGSGNASFSGPITVTGSLTLVGNNTFTTLAGDISGSGTLTEVGSGTLDLTAKNDFTGTTDVNAGTLLVDGSTAAGNAISVGQAFATLGGAGTVAGTITLGFGGGPASGANLSPGAGPDPQKDTGTLKNSAGVTFLEANPLMQSGPPAFSVQLGGTSASPTNDQLNSAGPVALGDALLDLSVLPGAGPFNAGQQFVIVQAGAPISGTFNGLPQGSSVSDGTQNFTISYANDRVTLTALPVGAATITWTGKSTTSSNWSDPSNWDLGRAPINGDSLVFPASASRRANNDDIPGLSVNSITFQGAFTAAAGAYALSGDDLTIGAGGIIDAGSTSGAASYVLNQISNNVVLGADESWSIHDGDNFHHLFFTGNVDTAGFTLTATGNGVIDIGGQIGGTGGLTVNSGAAANLPTLELESANTYTGATAVEGGRLIVNGSTAAASAVSVDPGGVLGGRGTVGGAITVIGVYGYGEPYPAGTPGGALDPGTGPDPSTNTGVLYNTGGVTFKAISLVPPGGIAIGEPYTFSDTPEFDVQFGPLVGTPAIAGVGVPSSLRERCRSTTSFST